MKNFKLILSVFFVILMFNSCENEEDLFIDDTTNSDTEVKAINDDVFISRGPTLTFGVFFGKCIDAPCVSIFKLTPNILLRDRLGRYPSSTDYYKGSFGKFGGANLVSTKGLLSEFPSELLRSKLIVIGSPDAGDRGGVYLEYQDLRTHQFWLLDMDKNNIPKYLWAYVDRINETVNEIDNLKSPIKD